MSETDVIHVTNTPSSKTMLKFVDEVIVPAGTAAREQTRGLSDLPADLSTYVDGPPCQRPIAAPPALRGNVGSCIAAWRTSKRPTHGHRQIRSRRCVGMDDDLSGQGAQADPSGL